MTLPPRIDYRARLEAAMRGLVRALLEEAARDGLPGDHHFLLTFRTTDPGVVLSADLRARYPDEMTVVLEHQFWDLAVDDQAVSVTLRFSGRDQRLVVPWPALIGFADPSAEFGVRLQNRRSASAPAVDQAPQETPRASQPAEGSGSVVRLEDFRRR